VSIVLVPRGKAEIAREVASIEAAGKRVSRTKATARAFLIKHGFMTKSGKLAKMYRG